MLSTVALELSRRLALLEWRLQNKMYLEVEEVDHA